MPVRFEINRAGLLEVRQSFDFPAVYLDHWAVLLFSTDTALGNRFLASLRASGGALVISHMNLAELTGPEDPQTVEQAAQFLESVLPNAYFAMFDLQQAIDQESQPRELRTRLPAPPDIELLRTIGRERPDDMRPFTIANLIRVIAAHRDHLGTLFRESNQRMADRINHVRLDADAVEQARDFRGHPVGVASRAVMQELMRPTLLDQRLRIVANDGADFMHAIVSIVYCDFVLLDRRWEELHARMVRRFAELRYPLSVAQVFSRRHDGVERFLLALEARRIER